MWEKLGGGEVGGLGMSDVKEGNWTWLLGATGGLRPHIFSQEYVTVIKMPWYLPHLCSDTGVNIFVYFFVCASF